MVNWTADKDSQLLLGIFEYMDIKFSQPLLKHLAEKIGEGCTAKAVSHRLNNIKARGRTTNTPTATPTKSTNGTTSTSKGTPRTPATNKRSGGGGGRGKKRMFDDDDEMNPQDDDEDILVMSPSAGRGTANGKKRGRKAKKDDDDDEEEEEEEEFKSIGIKKRVKVEKSEDDGVDSILGGEVDVDREVEEEEEDEVV